VPEKLLTAMWGPGLCRPCRRCGQYWANCHFAYRPSIRKYNDI